MAHEEVVLVEALGPHPLRRTAPRANAATSATALLAVLRCCISTMAGDLKSVARRTGTLRRAEVCPSAIPDP